MGIQGLSAYMDNFYSDNSQVFQNIELNSCNLLIDGNCLLYRMHSLYFRSSHGGNYDAMRDTLTDLLDKFVACKIRPIVLFDGARDRNDRKLKTSLKRAYDRLGEMKLLNSFSSAGGSHQATNGNNKTSKKKSNKSKSSSTAASSKKISVSKLIESGQYRVFCNLLPINSFQLFMDLLESYSIPHYQCFFEADYELGKKQKKFKLDSSDMIL